MQASEPAHSTVRRAVRSAGQKVSGMGRTDGRTVAGQFSIFFKTFNELMLSGALSGAVRTFKKSAVCPVGVSLGHPTPDTRTNVQPMPTDPARG